MNLSPELYRQWAHASDPLALDAQVRKALNIPEDRYYSVGRFPHEGQVTLLGHRHVAANKISKSDQL